jgi:hypothetical protein
MLRVLPSVPTVNSMSTQPSVLRSLARTGNVGAI